MAVEQSKAPSKELHAQASKGALSFARKNTSVPDAKAGGGFASVLASTDQAEETSTAAPSSILGAGATANGQKSDGVGRLAAAQRADKSAPRSEQKVEPDKGLGRKSVVDEADGQVSFAADRTDPSQQALIPGGVAFAANGLPAVMGSDIPFEGGAQSVVSAGAPGRGFMRTSQLQQSLAMGSEKNLGGQGFSQGRAARSSAVTDAQGDAVANVQSAASMDPRQVALGKAMGMTESMVDASTKMMSLMATVASQAEHGSSERRGQDDVRGVGSPTPETWAAEPADTAGQVNAGFSMEDAPVQETVRYWVGADTKQQAELTVNDVGGGSVDVTIHMHGKDAQVSFRADEQQARDALQAASGQLKHMLGQEGLTLSGLSVGTSLAGQDGRQEPRSERGAGKTAKVAAGTDAVAATGTTTANAGGGALTGRGGRALDLFV